MSILAPLKFVQGAVSTKSLIPEMKHFVIQGGHVRGFNGTIALSSPIEFDLECAPLAVPLVRAIQNCKDVAALNLTPANRLSVKSGKFRAYIDCVEVADLPHQQPEGEEIEFDGEQMLAAIEKLSPFVGNDASRPWTNGILLRDRSAFATNNVCLVEYWIGSELPFTINIPMPAIKEVARIGQPPTHAQVSHHSITFHYEDGRWVRTQLYETEWPDLARVLDQPSAPVDVPEDLFEGLEQIKPFLEGTGRVYFRNGAVYTEQVDELGASYEVPGLHTDGIYNLNMLSLLKPVAERADFTTYPSPCLFYGDRLRGAIIGQRA